MSKMLGLLSAAVLLLAWASTSAMADTSYTPTGSFATTQGMGDGEVSDPQHVAVETSTGNILIVDRGNNRVQVFAPDGAGSATYLAQFGTGVLDGPTGIAIDQSTGAVYVSDADDVVKFTTDGAPTPTYTQDVFFTSPGVTGPLAFDQGADVLVVGAVDHLRRFGTTGTAGASSDGSASGTAFSDLKDVAVQDDGDIVAIDGARVVRFERDGSYAATITGLPGAADVVATVPGTNNLVIGDTGGYNSDFTVLDVAHLYRVTGDAYHATAGAGDGVYILRGLAVSAAAGAPLYAVTGSDWFGGSQGAVAYQSFAVQPPVISGVAAVEDETTTAVRGTIDSQQDATAWAFEYGTTTAYGKQSPVTSATLAAGSSPVAVTRTLAGLTAGTTYHYRLVATNGGGTTNGADHTFTTTTNNPAGESTSNGYAYEMVSPLEKNGVGIQGSYNDTGISAGTGTSSVQISPDGNAVAYSAFGAFPGAEAAAGFNRYLSRRSSTDWTSTALDPSQRSSSASTRPQFTFAMSDDLTKTLVYSNRALGPGGVDDSNNVYIRDNDTKQYTLVVTSPQMEDWSQLGNGFGLLQGYTPDLSQVLFQSDAQLTPDAPAGPNTYEWRAGSGLKVLLAPSTGPALGASPADFGGDKPLRQSMSRDGRRILVVPRTAGSPESGCSGFCDGIYLLQDGQPAIQVSASQRTGDDPSQPQPVHYQGTSRDLSVVYFSSVAELTDASDTAAGGAQTVYRYDLDSGVLTDLLAGVPAADRINSGAGDGLAAVTPDGSRIYFIAAGNLVPGAPSDSYQLYMWHDGTLSHVPTTGSMGFNGTLYRSVTAFSANSRYFAFQWNTDLTDYASNGNYQMYIYDAVLDKFSCASCNPSGEAPRGNAVFNPLKQFGLQHYSNAVLDDGTAVFASSDPLVRADVNGKRDVYAWRDGQPKLISTGKGAGDAIFADMSADGSTIAFATAARLVPRDTDDLNDMYVARAGGGLPAQAAAAQARPACAGAACQGEATPPTAVAIAASVTFAGAGDLPPAARRHLKVSASKVKTVTGTAGALSVTVSAKGRIKLSGAGLTATSRTAAKAGKYTVTARLTSAARKRLAKSRRYVTKARVTFTAAGGPSATATVQLTFKLKTTTKKKGL
jgi:hypothetical protein